MKICLFVVSLFFLSGCFGYQESHYYWVHEYHDSAILVQDKEQCAYDIKTMLMREHKNITEAYQAKIISDCLKSKGWRLEASNISE